MAKTTSRRLRADLNPLVQALRDALAKKGPQAIIAKETGVSTKTLSPLLKGHLPESKDSQGRLVTKITPQRVRGVVPALARLLTYANVPSIRLEDLLEAYGIAPDEDESRHTIQRARREAGRPKGIDDVVTADIYAREKQEIRIGAVAWPPFLEPGDPAEGSLAYQFLVSLFGSIYPTHPFDAHRFDTLREAIDALVTQPMAADAVFGVYELPARAALGLRFVPIPGLTVALGALQPKGAGFCWRDILGLTGRERPLFVVSQEEAGELFLQGACRRTLTVPSPTDTMHRESHANPEDLALRLVALRAQRPSQPVGLLMESMTCKVVLDILTTQREQLQQRLQRTYPNIRSLDSPYFDFEHVPPDAALTPRYPLGIAIRADANRLHELIELALDIDVFGTAIGKTARWYFDLFQKAYGAPPEGDQWTGRDGIHFNLDAIDFDPKLRRLHAAMKSLVFGQPELKPWLPPYKGEGK